MALLAPFNPSGKKQDILQFAFASRLLLAVSQQQIRKKHSINRNITSQYLKLFFYFGLDFLQMQDIYTIFVHYNRLFWYGVKAVK
jgi:hypothetical protein